VTAIICYSAAVAVDAVAVALGIVATSDPHKPTGLGQWADIAHHAAGRRHRWRHAPRRGRRPNAAETLAGVWLPPEPLAIEAAPAPGQADPLTDPLDPADTQAYGWLADQVEDYLSDPEVTA
jgi:hypothetical protein